MSQMPSRSLVICVVAASLCDPASGECRVRVDGHRFGSGVGHGQRDVLAWAHLKICPGCEVLVRIGGADGLDHRSLGQRGAVDGHRQLDLGSRGATGDVAVEAQIEDARLAASVPSATQPNGSGPLAMILGPTAAVEVTSGVDHRQVEGNSPADGDDLHGGIRQNNHRLYLLSVAQQPQD